MNNKDVFHYVCCNLMGLSEQTCNKVRSQYNQGHRRYHNITHVYANDEYIQHLYYSGQLDNNEYDLMRIANVFHDVVYEPTSKTNEEDSVAFMRKLRLGARATIGDQEMKLVERIILDSDPFAELPDTARLSILFRQADCHKLEMSNLHALIQSEKAVFREFQMHDWTDYKAGRLEVLDRLSESAKTFAKDPEKFAANIQLIKNYLQGWKPKIAIYPGSFNPFHRGHLSILTAAEKIFDKVIVAVGSNPSKPNAQRSLDERSAGVRDILRYHQVDTFSGLLTDYINSKSYPVTVIRGLRTDTDFKQEEVQLRLLQDMMPDIRVVFIPCEKRYEHVSSSAIRTIKSIRTLEKTDYECDHRSVY